MERMSCSITAPVRNKRVSDQVNR
jgi:hypothetical protein